MTQSGRRNGSRWTHREPRNRGDRDGEIGKVQDFYFDDCSWAVRYLESVMQLTAGRGVDTAIEAVGVPSSFQTCQEIVAAGGHIANIGVHGVKVDLHLERLWSQTSPSRPA